MEWCSNGLAIFCVLRKLIFVIGKDWFSCCELIFAIFWKSCSNGTDNIFVFYLGTCNQNADKTTWECKTD